MRRFSLRSRLLLTVTAAVTVALIVLIAGFNLILDDVLDRDARDLVRTRAVTQLDSLHINHGRLKLAEAPDDRSADAFVWIFVGSRAIEQPRVPAETARVARALTTPLLRARFADVPTTDTRLYAAPIVAGGRHLGTVVAGVSLAPYEQTRKLALLASTVLAAIVLAVVFFASRWLLQASLRPVARMTRQAAEWSESDLEHRFAPGPPHDELTELAATLDGLLDRVAASLRHERRFSAELSHELRTPLARVRAESELALRRDRQPHEYRQALELIQRNAEQLTRTIDALVAAARYEAGAQRGTADAQSIAEDAVRACTGLAADRHVNISVSGPDRRLRVGIDADLAERVLQPVLENACRYGTSAVHVAIGRKNSSILYTIDDDGPGVRPEEASRIFEPGVRGTASLPIAGEGAGLGLALALRLARSVEGDIVVDAAPSGGRFVVRLPTG
jgi:signal transduction histidine kinase